MMNQIKITAGEGEEIKLISVGKMKSNSSELMDVN